MVVDDDILMRNILCESLRGRGHEVSLFSTGEAAWQAFDENPFPLALVDWGLPDITGKTLCERIRAHPRGEQTALLMITGNKSLELMHEALRVGADDYLFKPFSLELLDVRLAIAEQQMWNRVEKQQAEMAMIRSQQLAAVGTLAAGVAHEFNNINTSALGFLDLTLQDYELQDDVKEMLTRVRRSVRRSSDLTRRLLTFVGIHKQENGRINLNSVIDETLKMLVNEMDLAGVVVSTTLKDLPDVCGSPSEIGQVLMNLLLNAHQAMQGKSDRLITIESGEGEGGCYLSIRDTGCGIPAANLNNIFLPFYSTKGEHSGGDPVNSRIKGTGLGLSVCDTIVRHYHGRMEVESKPGTGTTFTVWLPLAGTSPYRAEMYCSPPEGQSVENLSRQRWAEE